MALNATRLRKLYRPIPETPFVYYPFHVPADMALTLRSPEYLDQVATIDFLLRTIPDSHVLVVKEHPAQIGAIAASRLFELARRFDNFVLLPPQTNNYTVLNRADAVISVNSKSGAEALLLGKPVVVMGDAFYRTCPLVFAVDRLPDVPHACAKRCAPRPFDPARGAPYFEVCLAQVVSRRALYRQSRAARHLRGLVACRQSPNRRWRRRTDPCMPLVSIITPSWNVEGLIGETIEFGAGADVRPIGSF